ncbi:restriction endonuclease subunit S [Neolewinella sp.]|uniref:restriction endonuclease subunit S n=1 Tax=Neolewinella sp. TaxID=2993543 RepID=UPI003B51B111
MKGLKTYKFNEIYEMSSGISTKPVQAGHGSPFLSFSTVFNNYYLPEVLVDSMATSDKEKYTFSIKKGDVFLTRTSETIDELGMSCVALKDYPEASYSGFVKRLRPVKNEICYDKYMTYYLRSKLFRKTMTNNAVMTLRASLNEQIFSYLQLILPSYTEQKKAGDLLYSISEKIDLNNRINAELEALARTIYDYWFLQFDFPDAAGRPYRSAGGRMVYDVPFGWVKKNILEVADLLGGGTPSKRKSNYWGGNIPFFTPSDAKGAVFSFDTEAYTTPEGINNCSSRLFDPGTIFITARGSVGRLAIAGRPMGMNQSCYALSPKVGVSSAYLYFKTKELIKHLKVKSSGSVFNSIVSDDIKWTILTIPPLNIIEKFSECVNPMFDQIANLTAENRELAGLRDWLLPLLMSGEVRVGSKQKAPTSA